MKILVFNTQKVIRRNIKKNGKFETQYKDIPMNSDIQEVIETIQNEYNDNNIKNDYEKVPEELKELATKIYYNAERGFAEYETAKAAADFLRKYGMEPREGLALTGVKANINESEGPSVALIGELDGIGCPAHPDAVKATGISHACGHEAQMIAVLGAALALNDPEVKAALGGKAIFFGVPAEENLSADIKESMIVEFYNK